jgi:glycosyltransferase involved in cell wall biosynthesis
MQHKLSEAEHLIVVSQSLVVSGYRTLYEHLARDNPRLRIDLIVPTAFKELGGQVTPCEKLDPLSPENVCMHPLRCFSPHFQIVLFWGLSRLLRRLKGQAGPKKVVLALFEPYSLSYLWFWLIFCSSGLSAPIWTYTAQNIVKRMPILLRWVQWLCFQTSSAILAVGREQESVLRFHGYLGRVVRFPLWYDEQRFKFEPQSGSQRPADAPIQVGYCGKISEEKGVFDLLEAFRSGPPMIRERCTLIFAGDGPHRRQLDQEVDALSADGFSVRAIGHLSYDAVPEFYHSLDVLVVPSRTTSNWKEQFGRVIIEALACGVTVLGSDSGEIPVVIGDDQRVFREKDPASLAECLSRYLSPDARLRATNAQYAFHHYSSRAAASRLGSERVDFRV